MKTYLWIMIALLAPLYAQDPTMWHDIADENITQTGARQIVPQSYRTLFMDRFALEDALSRAPMEGSGPGILFSLPDPDGGMTGFHVVESPIMAPELAARYPEIKTWLGRGVKDRTALVRFDLTPHGFHAMVRGAGGAWYIDPFQTGDDAHLISYYRSDFSKQVDWTCHVTDTLEAPVDQPGRVPVEGELLTYRTAVACTGEYATFHGGTVPAALAAIVTTLNRVNVVYEMDVAIRMELIAENDQVIFLDAGTDPYTNNSGGAMLTQNQNTLDSIIGSANYDVGHVLSTGGGGVAFLASTCVNGIKARGVTGLPAPVGDPFDIDFVAHELGHQWGGAHTFNGTTGACGGSNRSAGSAYEPGSGATIMAYAGICGAENLQNNSDPYFHVRSYDQIIAHSRSGGGTCGVQTVIANNAPEVEAGPGFNIPQSTPFTLTGSATDSEGDSLTYCWEQFDLGPPSPPLTDDGQRPIFRSFDPVARTSRTFPKWSDILGNTQTIGEVLPTTDRTLTFRLTVRDNHPGGGGVDYDSTVLNVSAGSGPFLVTSPNTAVTWSGTSTETVSWDVAGTDNAPVSCNEVDILLSSDGGQTYDVVVAANVPNTGSAEVTVPNQDIAQSRLMIKCSDNIFFDVSDADLTVESNPLVCTTDLSNWLAASNGLFVDNNNNGLVDIADLLICLDL